jgi:hypothetical protein
MEAIVYLLYFFYNSLPYCLVKTSTKFEKVFLFQSPGGGQVQIVLPTFYFSGSQLKDSCGIS